MFEGEEEGMSAPEPQKEGFRGVVVVVAAVKCLLLSVPPSFLTRMHSA